MIGVWLSRNCVRHPRISGGVVVLLWHFNEWLRGQNQAPYDLAQFRSLLEGLGHTVIEVQGTLLVPGLGLVSDLEFYRKVYAERKRVQ